MAAPSRRRATLEDIAGRADVDRLEIIDGEIVEKATPTAEHGFGQSFFGGVLGRRFDRKPGGRWPGGWWIGSEIHVAYGDELFCHDVVGWRRERVPERPHGFPIRTRPDWVCEILSPSNEKRDLVQKPRTLLAAQVPHYWILDVHEKVLLVQRWTRDGYTTVQQAMAGETVRAEPFDAIELRVSILFGDEEDEE